MFQIYPASDYNCTIQQTFVSSIVFPTPRKS